MKERIEKILTEYQILREKIWAERDAEFEKAKKAGYNAFTFDTIEKQYSEKQFSSLERKTVEELIAEITGNEGNEKLLNELVNKIMLKRDY